MTESTSRSIVKKSRWLKGILLCLILLIALLAMVIGMLTSSAGQRQLLRWADDFTDSLSFGQITGGLSENNGLILDNVHFSEKNSDLAISRVQLKMPLSCLLHGELCINQLAVLDPTVQLSVAPSQENQPAPAKNGSMGKISLPLSFNIQNVQVKNLNLTVKTPTATQHLQLANFQTALTGKNNGLTLEPTTIAGLTFSTSTLNKKTPAKPSKPQPIDWKALEKQLSQPLLTLKGFTLPLNIEIKQIQGDNWLYTMGKKPNEQIRVPQLRLSANANSEQIALSQLSVKSSLGDVNLTAQLKTSGDFPVKLNATGSLAAINKLHPLYHIKSLKPLFKERSHFQLTATGALNKTLALDVQTTGFLPAQLLAKAQLTTAKMPFSVNLTSAGINYPFKELIGELNAQRAYIPTQFKQLKLVVNGDILAYQGALNVQVAGGNLPPSPLDVTFNGGIDHIDLSKIQLYVGHQQNLTLNGKLSWRNGFKWDSNLNLKNFPIDKILQNIPAFKNLPKLPAVLSGTASISGTVLQNNQWHIDIPRINLHGLVSNQPFKLNVIMDASADKGLNLPMLDFVYGRNNIDGRGVFGKVRDLHFNINAPDLRGIFPDLTASLFGQINLTGEQNPTHDRLKIDANLRGENIRFQTFHLKNFTLTTKVSTSPQWQGELSLRLNDLHLNQETIRHAELIGGGSERDHQFTLTSQGDPVAMQWQVKGNYHADTHIWRGELSKADVKSPFGKWQTDHNVKFAYNFNVGQAVVFPHCWQNVDASICFTHVFSAGKIGYIPFEIKNIDLALVNKLIKQKSLFGMLSGNGQVRWFTQRAPTFQVALQGKDIVLNQRLNYRYLRLIMPQVNLNGGMFNNDFIGKVAVKMEMPAVRDGVHFVNKSYGDIDADLKVQDVMQKRLLSGKAQLKNLSLAIFNQLFSKSENIQGNVEGELQLGGNLQQPRLDGYVQVSDVKAQLKLLPMRITNGGMIIEFFGDHAKFDSTLFALNGANPEQVPDPLIIQGDANWKDFAHYQANLNIRGESIYLSVPMSPTIVALRVSPDVQLAATENTLSLNGDITIPWAKIDVQALPENSISPTSDLVILDGPNKTKASDYLTFAKTGRTSTGHSIQSNVKIHFGDNVNLKAYGLNTNLTGTLALIQQQGSLGLYGRIDLKNGHFVAYGQNLLIKEGYIGFNGLPSKPVLNINAIRNPTEMYDSNITAGIDITGYADSPSLKIYTRPAKSQEEALSYLLTGQGIEDATNNGNSTNALSSALLSMSLAKTSGIVSGIGKVFGLQNLNIGTRGVGDKSQVAISTNLTDRIHISYGVGLFTGIAELTVRFKLLPKLYLQSISSLNQAFDLLYQFEI